MIGLSQTARAKAVFDAVGSDIGASGIPFLSDITVNSVFEKQGNVFSMRPSQDDERVPAMAAFIKAGGQKKDIASRVKVDDLGWPFPEGGLNGLYDELSR